MKRLKRYYKMQHVLLMILLSTISTDISAPHSKQICSEHLSELDDLQFVLAEKTTATQQSGKRK